ncbi:hypothetical protein SEA_LILBEANIE_47 [Gordonia phage Lilbeanie]|uniref:DNA-binding phage zinc finger domain-containing protein n=1 Tax=Gordonia phage Lilbeanie TaxID=2794947 RepID=A0A7T1NXK6_9CAUD|nr:hypothetical protein J1773_gp47 [Gordonia phage Lilbeanie]QPO17125.1 hypothetical protein SEA_LILBEANIE_47 [Gordonia phage Lilbeanie]
MTAPRDPLGPLAVECPACFSPVGSCCTEPTENSRRQVLWSHVAREARAQEAGRDA